MSNKSQNKKKQVLLGLMWRLLERFGAQGVTFVVSLILARLLEPSVYGSIAIVTVFIAVLSVFIDSGLGNALIQKKDADDLDFSSVFWFNLCICAVLYVVLFFSAPIIATYYRMPELNKVIRVMGILLIISGVKNVQQSYISRNLLFKKFFFATIGGTIGAAVLGIWMASRGFGVWALVAQSLLNNTIDTMVLWITVRWRPQFVFSLNRFKSLFSFGWKILVSQLIDTVYNNLRQLIIGKMYKTENLAFYNRGYMIPNVFATNANSAIDSVLFPVMADAQDSIESVRSMTRRSVQISSYVFLPIMLGVAAISKPLVILLLTEKWLPCVPYVIIFCVSYIFLPLETANLNAIKALGHGGILLRLTIIKKVIGFSILVATMWYGPLIMAASNLFFSIINHFINAYPNKKYLGYPYTQQIADILPNILLSLIMFSVVWSIQYLKLGNGMTLTFQVIIGIVIYIVGSKVMNNESYEYLLSAINDIKNRKSNLAF